MLSERFEIWIKLHGNMVKAESFVFKRLKFSLVKDYFAKHSDYTRKVSKILLNDMIKYLDIEKRLIGMSFCKLQFFKF